MSCEGCARRRQKIADALKAATDAMRKLVREEPVKPSKKEVRK